MKKGNPINFGEVKDKNFKPEDGWQKMSRTEKTAEGTRVEVHYQYNEVTNQVTDLKVIDRSKEGVGARHVIGVAPVVAPTFFERLMNAISANPFDADSAN